MKIHCPTCKKQLEVAADWPHRPFCCDHCKMADLGRWLDEDYTLSRPIDPEEDDDLMRLS